MTPTCKEPLSTSAPPTTMTVAMEMPVSESTIGTMTWAYFEPVNWVRRL